MLDLQAAIGFGWMISILRFFVDAPYRVTLSVSSSDFSKADQVWTQHARGAKTDEPQLGHRGLHVCPSAAKTSSQSIHSKAFFRFMIASVIHALVAGQLLMREVFCCNYRKSTLSCKSTVGLIVVRHVT